MQSYPSFVGMREDDQSFYAGLRRLRVDDLILTYRHIQLHIDERHIYSLLSEKTQIPYENNGRRLSFRILLNTEIS